MMEISSSPSASIIFPITMVLFVNSISSDVQALVEARKKANRIEAIAERAKAYSQEVKDMMDKVRLSADNLEMLIDDEMWPLPKYRELLFF